MKKDSLPESFPQSAVEKGFSTDVLLPIYEIDLLKFPFKKLCVVVFVCFCGDNQFVVDGVGVHNFYAKIHKQGEMAKFFF